MSFLFHRDIGYMNYKVAGLVVILLLSLLLLHHELEFELNKGCLVSDSVCLRG